MYPTPPFRGFTWPLTHHMGIVNARNLWQILFAAFTHSDSNDPSTLINEYLTVNRLLPPNIRRDSGQSEIWRDYQQVLSELGVP